MKNKILKILAIAMIVPCAAILTACSFNIKDINWKFWEKEPSVVQEETPTEPDTQTPEPTEPQSVSFAADSWETISEISASGNARDYYNIGDEKEIIIANDTYTLQILGFNHDNLADGSGKAGITIGMKNLFRFTFDKDEIINKVVDFSTGGWVSSIYENTDALPFLLNNLSADLKSQIKPVNKISVKGVKNSETLEYDAVSVISVDNLFLFSEEEIIGMNDVGFGGEGEQYEYWATIHQGEVLNPEGYVACPDNVKYLFNGTGAATGWFLRTERASNIGCNYVSVGGGITYASSQSRRQGICFGFCV